MKNCVRIVLANKQIQQLQDTNSMIQKSIASVYISTMNHLQSNLSKDLIHYNSRKSQMIRNKLYNINILYAI